MSSKSSGGSSPQIVYQFESFRLDPANRILANAGKEIPLPGRAFDALLLLVQNPGSLVTKEELMTSVWQGSFVEEANLTVAISTLRRALSEDPENRRYIQTVARRGYRFIAEVVELHEAPRTAKVVVAESSPGAEEQTEAAAEVAASRPAAANGHAAQASDSEARATRVLSGRWTLTLLVAGLLIALTAGGWYLLLPRQPMRSLAVLPFTVEGSVTDPLATASASNESMLIGMTDAMISRLSSEMVVRPTSSVLRYSGAGPVDPVVAGREQDVDAVLTGTIERTGDKTTLKMRLIRVRDGFTLWQSSVQAPSGDLSKLSKEAGTDAASEIRSIRPAGISPKKPAAAEADRASTNDPAYQLYLLGRYFWNRRTEDGLHKSIDYFSQSINADPNFAPAYAGLADSYALLASFSIEPGRMTNADARSAALSAIHLDPTLADPHASLGMIYFFTDWNLPAAEQEFEQAIRLNPNYATAHHWYALDLAAMNRPAQAVYEIRLARSLDPLSLIIGTNVGWVEYLGRDYPDALRDLHRVLELDPNFARARTRLGMVEMAMGDNAAAVADLTRALALSGDEDPWVRGLLGEAEARAGNRAAAEKALADLRRANATRYVPPISRALILLGLGRNDEAMTALEQAADDHSTSMVYARVDPSFDPIRSDPAFQALLARNKL